MNRSKSTNTFNNFSYANYFNCQDIQIDDRQQHSVDRHYGVEEMDLGWMKIFQEKDNRARKRKKLDRVRSGAMIGLANRYRTNPNDSTDLKQKIKQSKLLPYQHNQIDTYQSHYNEDNINQHPKIDNKKQQNHTSLTNIPSLPSTTLSPTPSTSTTLVLKQQGSIGSQQKIQPKSNILLDNNIYSGYEYKRVCEIGGYHDQQRRNREMFLLKERELELLKQVLMEETQSKQSIIKSRDLLLNELSEILQIHQTQLTTLKTQLASTQTQLITTSNQLSILKTESTQKQQKISSLSQFTIQQQQIIQMLTSANNNYCNEIQRYQLECERFEGEINKFYVQNRMLYEEIDILVESLNRVREELAVARGDCGEYQRLGREKDQELQNLRTEVEKFMERCQLLERDNEDLRRNLAHSENHTKQLQKSTDSTNDQITNLYKIIQTLTATTTTVEKSQLPTPTQYLSPSPELQQLNYLKQQLKYLLSISQNDHIQTPQILTLIYNVVQFNMYSTQVVSDYREILDMFGIQAGEQGCHERLLAEIGDFRSNIGGLVKKIRTMEKKIGTITEQNKRLVTIIKNGYSQSTQDLENLIQQQNQQILKYRLHLSNLKMAQHSYYHFNTTH